MKKIFIYGILGIIAISAFTYISLSKNETPEGVNPLSKENFQNLKTQKQQADEKPYNHPLLSEKQEQLLINAGVDIKNIPTEVTKEQEACAEEKISKERVDEIKAGSAPTKVEMVKLSRCL